MLNNHYVINVGVAYVYKVQVVPLGFNNFSITCNYTGDEPVMMAWYNGDTPLNVSTPSIAVNIVNGSELIECQVENQYGQHSGRVLIGE